MNVRADDFLTGIELCTGAMEQPEFQLDNWAVPDCKDVSTTTYVCTGTIGLNPARDLGNAAAGRP
ncbi:hypothetical protein ACFU9X_13985 [Streptomyces atratus]|uniref:hypothetical protein n=1 Tax=Streptomyces atratus TaxID=1893 RepID=UPI0036CCC099